MNAARHISVASSGQWGFLTQPSNTARWSVGSAAFLWSPVGTNAWVASGDFDLGEHLVASVPETVPYDGPTAPIEELDKHEALF